MCSTIFHASRVWRDNLHYRCPEAPDEEFARAADLLSLDHLLSELPDGVLGRALVGSPRVLLLDEADANLDAEARALVDQLVRAQRGRSTLIVVSHRAEVLEWADAIWRLDNGRLAAGDPTWRRAGPRLAPGAGAGERHDDGASDSHGDDASDGHDDSLGRATCRGSGASREPRSAGSAG